MKKRLGIALILFFCLLVNVKAEENSLMYGEFISHSDASEKGIEWYDFDKENNQIIAYGKEYSCEVSESGKCNSYYFDFESKEFKKYNKVAINAVMVSEFRLYDDNLYVDTIPDYYYSDKYVSKELKASTTKYDIPVVDFLKVLSYKDGENNIKELALITVPSEGESDRAILFGIFSSDGKWVVEPSDEYTYAGGNKELLKLQKENGDYVFITSPESVETISQDFASSIPYFDIDKVGATIIDGKIYYDVSYTEQPGRISPLYYYFTNEKLLTSGTWGDELIKIGDTLWAGGSEKYDCSDEPAGVYCLPTSSFFIPQKVLHNLDYPGYVLGGDYHYTYEYELGTNSANYILLKAENGEDVVYDGKVVLHLGTNYGNRQPLGIIDSPYGFNGSVYVYTSNLNGVSDDVYENEDLSLYVLYDEDDDTEPVYCEKAYRVEYDFERDMKIVSALRFYDKEGNVVTEEEYKKDCVTEEPETPEETKNICKKVGDAYYGKDGRVVTFKEYSSECSIENPNTGSFILISVVAVATVGAAIVLRKTKILSRFRRI